MDEELTTKELREARDRFRDLLGHHGSREADFQRLFSECPFILSRSLPLKLSITDIIAQGKPGESGADFVIYPHRQRAPFVIGAIELKRPDSPILTVPRKDLVVLSRDSATALAQARENVTRLRRRLVESEPICCIGTNEYMFLVVGLIDDLRRKASSLQLRAQVERLLPQGCNLIPYDALLQSFERTVPAAVYLLRPELDSMESRSPEWRKAADVCVEYIKKTIGPDKPDVTDVAEALGHAGMNADWGYAHAILLQLIDDGVIGTTDSLVPPWETLYFVKTDSGGRRY